MQPRLSLPKLSFKTSDEIKLPTDPALPTSSNDVKKVGYRCLEGDKRTKTAYTVYKKSFSDRLNRIQALYETAFSVYIRLSLVRAAEVRPVYEGDKLIGIASIELPGFIPMQKVGDPDYPAKDAEKQKVTKPDRATLLSKEINAAELLACCLCDKNWDLNPDNISVFAGLIDFGQYFYQLMFIFENKDIITCVVEYQPLLATKITAERIRNIIKTKERRHWPPQTPNKRSKAFKSKEAFRSLDGDTNFEEQVYFYLLKKILAFDKELLRKRLTLYLGEEPLGLQELPKTTRENLINIFGHSLFYDGERELTFVEHCVLFFETQYLELLTVLVHMPEFRRFMVNYPQAILEIKSWFITQNERSMDSHPDPDKPKPKPIDPHNRPDISYHLEKYNLDHIDTEYNIIYRDSFVQPICQHLSSLENLIDMLKPDVIKSYVVIDQPPEDKIRIITKSNKSDPSQSMVLIKKLPQIKSNLTKTSTKIDVEQKSNYEPLAALYKQLLNLTTEYYQQKKPTLETNHTYIRQVKELLQTPELQPTDLMGAEKQQYQLFITEFTTTLDVFWMTFVGDPPQLSGSFMLIPTAESPTPELIDTDHIELLRISSECDAARPLTPMMTTTEPFSSAPKPAFCRALSLSSIELPTLKTEELVIMLVRFTSEWLPKLSHEHINQIVSASLEEYKPFGSDSALGYFNYRAYLSTRTDEIISLQKKYQGINLLKEIIYQKPSSYWKSEPGWAESSFNTKLTKNLCLDMLKTYNQYNKDASELIQKNISNRCLQIESMQKMTENPAFSWSTVAKSIAEKMNWIQLAEHKKTGTLTKPETSTLTGR
jgi:hypothetical protein